MDIGNRIRKRREELNMTQEELAKKLGYANRSSVNKVETSREVSMKKINAYAIALETTVADLMGWTNQEEKPEVPDYDENTMELIMLFSKLNKEQKNSILNMMRSFALDN